MINQIILASKSGVRKKILNENGIDCDEFKPIKRQISREYFTSVSIGRFVQSKRFDLLIEVLKLLQLILIYMKV